VQGMPGKGGDQCVMGGVGTVHEGKDEKRTLRSQKNGRISGAKANCEGGWCFGVARQLLTGKEGGAQRKGDKKGKGRLVWITLMVRKLDACS